MILEPILVTGAGGFLGHAVLARLQQLGLKTVGTTRTTSPASNAALRACDIEDATAVEELFRVERPATVVHLASLVTGSRELAAVLPTFRKTLGTTVNLLVSAAEINAARVVLAGSMEELPMYEAPRYPYAAAKRAASDYGRFFHAAFDLSTITVRIGMVYGPGQLALQRLVPYLILSQLRGERPRLTSGDRRVDWLFVDDLVNGILAAADSSHSEVGGQVLDLGSGNMTSVADVARHVTAITGGPEPEFGAAPLRRNDSEVMLDTERTARLLGWRASVDLSIGLRSTVDWYRQEYEAGRVLT